MEETFAQRFKELMRRYDLTQTKLAKVTGLTHQTVRNLMEGSVPRFDTLVPILKYFKEVNARWLMLGEGRMFLSEDAGGNMVQDGPAEYVKNHEMLLTMMRKDREELEHLRSQNRELTTKLLALSSNKK